MRSLAILLLVATTASAKPSAPSAPRPYDVFRKARAECRKPGPALAAIVSKYWDPQWARDLVKDFADATDAQRTEFDALADQILGAYERRSAIAMFCEDRVTRRDWIEEEDDDGKLVRTNRYEIVVRNNRCAREYAPDVPCWCVHKIHIERQTYGWFYVGDGQLCGVPTTWQTYRRILGLPGGYARYGAGVAIELALEKLREAAAAAATTSP